MTVPSRRNLAGVLQRREVREAAFISAIVTSRAADGTAYVKRLDGTCEQRAGFEPGAGLGSIVTVPGRSVHVTRGLASASGHLSAGLGVGALESAGGGFLFVEALDPAEYEPGQSYSVTVTGVGFTAATVLRFLLAIDPLAPAQTAHPELTITSQALVSSEEITLGITVGAGAAPAVGLPLGYSAGAGQVERVKADAYGVAIVSTAVEAVYLLLTRDGSGYLDMRGITADGEDLGVILPDGYFLGVDGFGTSIYPAAIDGLGPACRALRDDSTGDIVVLDWFGPLVDGTPTAYTYTPAGSWVATDPMQIAAGGALYWWEWEYAAGATSTSIRLMTSEDATLSAPTEVWSGTINATTVSPTTFDVPVWGEYTTTHASLWLGAIDEVQLYEVLTVTLAGSSPTQRAAAAEGVTLGRRAGHPASASSSLSLEGDQGGATEGTELPARTVDATDPENDHAAWATVGDVVDISPDPADSGWWILRGSAPNLVLEHRSAAGALLDTINLDYSGAPTALSVHVLADPIEVTLP